MGARRGIPLGTMRQRGFTLIEMAFVVAILGLMVGGGLFAFGPINLRAKTNATNNSLDQVEAALVVFAIRNNRLPCPADGALTTADATYGEEVAQATSQCTITVKNSVVPWRTLGLDENYSLDGWSNRISYFPANAMIAGVDTLVDNTGAVAARTCPADTSGVTCTVCLARSTGAAGASTRATLCDTSGTAGLTPTYPYGNYLAVYSINNSAVGTETTSTQPAAGTITTTAIAATAGLRAAYVLVSHGPSGMYAWNRNGSQYVPATAHTLKADNQDGSAGAAGSKGFVQGTMSASTSQSNSTYFDDIVRWRSPAFIIQQCGSASCGNP